MSWKRKLSAAVLVAVAVTPLRAQEDAPLTLEQCYRLALERSETLAISEAEINEAEARYKQVRSVALPQAGLRGSHLHQDSGGDSDTDSNRSSGRRTRSEARLFARQRLFAGFRELASLQSVEAEISQRRLRRQRAEQLLYLDVAQAFYDVVDLEQRLVTLGSLRDLTQDRVRELQERIRIGRSRQSEALSAQSQLASIEADIEETKGLRDSSLQVLNFLTGRTVSQVSWTPDQGPPSFPSLEDSLKKLPSRYDLLAAHRNAQSSRYALSAVRRERWPTLNFEGNYYLKRSGFSDPLDWDVLLTAELPIFTGGQLTGSVGAAEARPRIASLALSRELRQAEQELRSVHSGLVSSLARAEKLKAAVDLAQGNYRVQSQEYRLGLVNNLEVLSALNAFYSARLEYESAQWDVRLNLIRLAVAMGEVPQ